MSSWISLFTDRITRCNPVLEERFRHWVWPIGTCLGDKQLWWGKQKKRLTPHEGVDLAYYIDKQGRKQQVALGLVVPVIFSGQIVQVHQDFLNQSVYVRHKQFRLNGAILHTIFGHVQPNEVVALEQEVGAGKPVALLEEYPESTVPLHLHFTMAWIPNDVPSYQLNWQMLTEHEQIVLIDPLAECSVEPEISTEG